MHKEALLFIAVLLGACGPHDTGDGKPNEGSQPGDGDTGDGDGDGDGDGQPGDAGGDTSEADTTDESSDQEDPDPNAIVKVIYGPKAVAELMVQGFAADDSMLADLALEVEATEFGSVATIHASVGGMKASWMLFNADKFIPSGDPEEYPLIRERAQALAAAVAKDGDGELATCAVGIADAVADCSYSPYEPSCRAAFELAYCQCRPWLPEVEHVTCWIIELPNA